MRNVVRNHDYSDQFIEIGYNPVFDSLLSIKTAVDQYLWMLQRFCLLF